MARQNNLGFKFGDTDERGIEVVDFKPQKYAIAIRLVLGIADRPVVMLDLKPVQLQNQDSLKNQPFIFLPAVVALTAKKSLIPPAAGFDISYGNQGLRRMTGSAAGATN